MRKILPAVLILLAGAYTGGWFYASHQAGLAIDRALANPPGGLAISAATVTRQGFPFAFAVDATGVAVTSPQGLRWDGAGITASTRPWTIPVVALAIAAPQTVTLSGPMPATLRMVRPGDGDIRLSFAGHPESARLSLPGVAIESAALPGPITIERVDLSADRSDGQPVLSGDVTDMALPFDLPAPLGTTIDAAGGTATLLGPWPRSTRAADLAAWRDAGGRVRIDRASLRWGPLDLAVTGELTLDAALQPAGTFTATVKGAAPVIAGLAQAGVIRPEDAARASVGLSLLAGGRDQAADRPARIDIAIANRQVKALFLTLARLPEIRWAE
jgi:hypothetical protein